MTATLDFTGESADGGLPRVGMAPLVDIVLLLICFYLLVMRSIQSHTEEYVRLPEIAGEHAAEVLPAELVINLKATGEIVLNGALVDLEMLRGLLDAEQARAVPAGAGTGRALRVVVRADAGQPYELLDDVLTACRDASISAITLRTRRERDR